MPRVVYYQLHLRSRSHISKVPSVAVQCSHEEHDESKYTGNSHQSDAQRIKVAVHTMDNSHVSDLPREEFDKVTEETARKAFADKVQL